MSKNKIALSLAVAGILGASSALAETDGAFVGLQAGYGGLKHKMESEYKDANDASNNESSSESISAGGFRYGFVAGYKQFFTPEFGARYYASFDLGTDYKKDITDAYGDKTTIKVNSYNITANADALYNFISSNDLDLGAFLGLSLGYAHHTVKVEVQGATEKMPDIKPSGFDLGINFGLRTNIAQNHGIELYSRFGVLQQKKELKDTYEDGSSNTITYKAQQPYQVGLRYTFSF